MSGTPRQSHCGWGHAMIGRNVVIDPRRNTRTCRACVNRRRRDREKNKRLGIEPPPKRSPGCTHVWLCSMDGLHNICGSCGRHEVWTAGEKAPVLYRRANECPICKARKK